MPKTKTQPATTLHDWLTVGVRRVALAHIVLLVAFAAQTVVMDAWDIIIAETVLQRWLLTAGLLVVIGVVWYLCHSASNSVVTLKRLAFALIVSDIVFAAANVYLQRGMASKSVALFAIPIAVAAILLSRSALYLTAMLATAAYITASVSYFVLYFNEGYKTELYAEVGFYSAGFFALAAILSAVVRFGSRSGEA